MQSRQGQALLLKHDLPTGRYDSFVYLESGSVYQRSEALLRIVGHLPRRWRWLELMRLCPRRWRDALYDWVARHRFRWFGRYASCPLPDPGWRERFLDR